MCLAKSNFTSTTYMGETTIIVTKTKNIPKRQKTKTKKTETKTDKDKKDRENDKETREIHSFVIITPIIINMNGCTLIPFQIVIV